MWANMYWYVKVALIGVLALVVFGIYVMLGKPGWPDAVATGDEPVDVVAGDPVPAHDPEQPPLIDRSGSSGAAPRSTAVPRENLSPAIMAAKKKIEMARAKFKSDHLMDARGLLENVLKTPEVTPYSATWLSATDLISQINAVFMQTDAPCPEKILYRIKAGDNLWDISRAHGTTVEMIQRINGLDETNPRIQVGQTLHIYQANWRIHVSKSNFLLVLYDGDRVLRTYPVGIGRQDRTPEGSFMMVDKVRDPPWTNKGREIPFNDPENVLGTRWMKLVATGTTSKDIVGYGIHGTWEPNSIGTAASNGCIRMRNEQVEDLFNILPVNVPVTISE